MPADVKTILAKACNDCHSNNTRYPWYANIQPVDWWLNKHVKTEKRELILMNTPTKDSATNITKWKN